MTEVNSKLTNYWDWQVTICYYSAVHTINAFLAEKADLHYRTHEDVKNAINPYNPLSIYKLSVDVYLSYTKLEGLSRRSRYLCHHDPAVRDGEGRATYDKHFAKAIKNLGKNANFHA